jgi:thiamine transport system substrate-binding protein
MRALAVATALALALGLVACGDDDDTADSGDASGGSVTVVTHDSFNVSDEVLAAFTERTGIEVELLPSGDAGSALNQAILTRDNPQGDVFFGVDNTFLTRAFDADLFVPYESPALADVDSQFVVDAEHRVTPVDFGDVCLNFDRDFFAAGSVPVPESLDDLTGSDYRDLLVVENPATSSPGLAFLLATVDRFGEDGYLDYWSRLRDNGVQVSDGWEDAYFTQFSGGAGEGSRPLVVSYASSPPAEVLGVDPAPAEAPTGVIEDGCFRQIEFAGILSGTENEAAAREFVDFLLSPEFQADMPLNMFVFPVVSGVELPELFTQYTEIPSEPVSLDPEEIGANRDRWIEEWTETVLR